MKTPPVGSTRVTLLDPGRVSCLGVADSRTVQRGRQSCNRAQSPVARAGERAGIMVRGRGKQNEPMGEQPDEALPRALIVDDEREVADAYALRLRGLCEVDTAYDGESALQAVREGEIDVVLLDRHMPGLSGDDVLDELDAMDYAGRVIMITAIDPGFDILDMPFDDYLCKPIEREDVRSAVEQQCAILGYEALGDYFSVESKRRVIAAELPADEREDHEEYQRTQARSRRLERRARRLLGDAGDLFDAFDDIGRADR